ncbi:hypothetical protein H0E87_016568 [Populus deltoides]|uniref:Uncharacterized protein n=1 Tax=Populus deltoides TaxID=3696 RepID=A0A8T2Y9V4_POPDE|nr:hypothetical protein H0E87_016568 [Populus deltoides]
MFDPRRAQQHRLATLLLRELLRGPLYYALTLILCALVFWRQSPTGVISMALVCGGDDIVDYCGVPADSRRQRNYFSW